MSKAFGLLGFTALSFPLLFSEGVECRAGIPHLRKIKYLITKFATLNHPITDLRQLVLQPLEVDPLVLLVLNVLEEVRVHRHGVHEESLDGGVIGDAPPATRVGLHPVDEDLHLGLEGRDELVEVLGALGAVRAHDVRGHCRGGCGDRSD